MHRDPRLSALRGLAALWVFLYHAHQIYHWEYPLIDSGYLGVPLFLMLSVSLLQRSLDSGTPLRKYFVRRVKRTWPLYFLAVTLVYFLLRPNPSVPLLIEHYAFISAWLNPFSYGYVFWTLQVEEAAYLAFPLIHRLGAGGKHVLAVALIVGGCLIDVRLYDTHYWFVAPSLEAYGFGLLVYLGHFKGMRLLAASTLIVAALYPDTYVGWALSPLVMLPMAAVVADPPARLGSLLPAAIGEVSYSIYLYHLLLLRLTGIDAFLLIWPVSLALEGHRIRSLPQLQSRRVMLKQDADPPLDPRREHVEGE